MSSSLENAKNTTLNSAKSAMASVQKNPTYQSVKDTVQNGPVAQNVKAETAKTRSEFADLANARQTPEQPAATGQPLTHYHSMFYRLLSWKNPRATAISFLSTVLFIFAARYLHVLRYIFKGLYVVLGVTAGAEIAGKTIMGNGLTSQMRPRKYFVIPKASLERLLDDVEQLINFFVIEFQRIVFAENVYATVAAFVSAFISYWLIKFLPVWGLTLIATTIIYLGPLVYLQNKELIDAQLNRAGETVSAQANQLRDMAAQHTGKAGETLRSYTQEYSNKASEMLGSARRRSETPSTVKKDDFPAAPQKDPISPSRPTPVAESY